MLVHSVYFWLKGDVSAAERTAIRAGLEGLRTIPTVRQLFVGSPANSGERDVIDRSYDIGLTVLFDDLAGLNVYGPHPLHAAFLKQFGTKWAKVVVYDAE